MPEVLRATPEVTESFFVHHVRRAIGWVKENARGGLLTLPLAMTPSVAMAQSDTPALTPQEIMPHVRGLGSSHYPKRDASMKFLTNNMNRDIMSLVAPQQYSADLETKRRAEEVLSAKTLSSRIEEFDPIPAYIKDHWLWLPSEKARVFSMDAISGPRKGEPLRLDEVSQLYRYNMMFGEDSYYDQEWKHDYGEQRRALWYLCSQKRNNKGLKFLQRSDDDLKKEWEEVKSTDDFPTWKVNRYRNGMKQAIEDIEKFALPFVVESKAWRDVQTDYKRLRPPVYPPSMKLQKTGKLRQQESMHAMNRLHTNQAKLVLRP